MPPARFSRRRLVASAGALAATALAGCSSPGTSSGDTTASNGTASTTDTETNDSFRNVFSRLYQQTKGSVVLVRAGQSLGTGFVFDDGHLVTNAHVVGTERRVEIRFHQGEWRTGDVLGRDRYSDLAAIEISDRPEYATPLSLVSDGAAVGQRIVIIGNPYSLDSTLTEGIVSGVNRLIPSPTGYRIPDAVQTDAAVNPGNSGGPIISLDGEVIAVINSGGAENIAFGISAALTERVVPALVEDGEYRHPYMGVSLTNVTPALAQANGLQTPRGVLVVGVRPGAPTANSLRGSTRTAVVDGQRVPVGGDVIVSIAGEEMESVEDVRSYVTLNASPGETISVTVLRNGRKRTLELTLGARPMPTS